MAEYEMTEQANDRRANIFYVTGKRLTGKRLDGTNVFHDTGKRPEGQLTRGAIISLPLNFFTKLSHECKLFSTLLAMEAKTQTTIEYG